MAQSSAVIGVTQLYDHPMIRDSFDQGMLIVTARAVAGQAGQEKAWLLSIVSLEDFMISYRAVQGSKEQDRKAGLRSLREAIRRNVLNRSGAELSRDDDFLMDLSLLLITKLVLGPEIDVEKGTGVAGLQLMVHPDETRPRERRGMLPTQIEAELAARGIDMAPRMV